MVHRFYFPLTLHTYEDNDWGIDWNDPTEGDGRAALRYRDDIEDALDRYNAGDDMGQYFYGSETVKAKIISAEWCFEAVRGCLYGRVDVTLAEYPTAEYLTAEETEAVKDWICGQNSDGLGEGFEQQNIWLRGGGCIQVSFWNPCDDYRIMTEDEFWEEVKA